MLRALYDYGKRHPEILLRPGCTKRTLKYIAEFTATGQYVMLRQSDKKNVICPDMGGAVRGSGTTANVLMEKASIAIQMDDGSSDDKLDRVVGKRQSFLGYFENGRTKVSAFGMLCDALSDENVLGQIQTDAVAAGVKPGDVIGFSVDGTLLSDQTDVLDWWTDYQSGNGNSDADCHYIDLITGQPCMPATLFKVMKQENAGGGQASGCALVSFNKRAFESYGLSGLQGVNAPMSQDTADTIMDALNYLGGRAPRLAGMKFLHWYKQDIPDDAGDYLDAILSVPWSDDDIMDDADDDSKEEVVEALATKLVLSPLNGEPVPELADNEYHIMVVKPEMSRLTIRHYSTGTYENLRQNLKAWYEDMSLISARGTRSVSYLTMNQLLFALLTVSERKAKTDMYKPVGAVAEAMLSSAIHGGPLPDAVCVRALNSIRSGIYSGANIMKAVQALKLWLNRRPGIRKEEKVMESVDKNNSNRGYHCGRLLAVYDSVQKTVMPEVNAGVLERYYSACCQSPALTLGRLQMLSNHHFGKMKSKARIALYQKMFSEIYSELKAFGEIPVQLSMIEKSYFAVGYWHEVAELNKRIAELDAKKAQSNAQDSDDDTEVVSCEEVQ